MCLTGTSLELKLTRKPSPDPRSAKQSPTGQAASRSVGGEADEPGNVSYSRAERDRV